MHEVPAVNNYAVVIMAVLRQPEKTTQVRTIVAFGIIQHTFLLFLVSFNTIII